MSINTLKRLCVGLPYNTIQARSMVFEKGGGRLIQKILTSKKKKKSQKPDLHIMNILIRGWGLGGIL